MRFRWGLVSLLDGCWGHHLEESDHSFDRHHSPADFSLFCIPTWQRCCPDQKRGQGWYWRGWLALVREGSTVAQVSCCLLLYKKETVAPCRPVYLRRLPWKVYIYIYICDLGMLWCILTEVYVRSLVWYVLVQNGIKSGTYVWNVHICTGFYTLNITMYVTHFCIYKLNLLRYFQVLHSGLEPQSINQLPHRPKDLLTFSRMICISLLVPNNLYHLYFHIQINPHVLSKWQWSWPEVTKGLEAPNTAYSFLELWV